MCLNIHNTLVPDGISKLDYIYLWGYLFLWIASIYAQLHIKNEPRVDGRKIDSNLIQQTHKQIIWAEFFNSSLQQKCKKSVSLSV